MPNPLPDLPPVGAHAPVAGGLATAGLAYAERVGAEAIQVFVSNPRGWATSAGNPREDAAFAEQVATHDLPVYVHATYLVNFGSPDERTLDRSVAAVRHALARARRIGARGVVVHTGSAVGRNRRAGALGQIHDHLLPLLTEIGDDGPDVLLEPMAGQGQTLCARVEELGPYLDALERHPRAGVCLDTCHVFAAGHDLTAPTGAAELFDALSDAAGPDRLKLIHANDSVAACGSRRDRHARIGSGHIGETAVARLLAHPMGRRVPWVVETPGGAEGHAADIATLRRLRSTSALRDA